MKKVEWTSVGRDIQVVRKETPKSSRSSRIRASVTGMLRIRNVKLSDAGRYSCSASVGGDPVVAMTTLHVRSQNEVAEVQSKIMERLHEIDSEMRSGAAQTQLAADRYEQTVKLFQPMDEAGGLKNKSYSIEHLRLALVSTQ